MPRKMQDLVIDRRIWLRGEGEDRSYLYRFEDEKMCCLGIYLHSLGVSKDALLNTTAPATLAPMLPSGLPLGAKWLLWDNNNSVVASNLMVANDTGTTGPLLNPDTCVEGDGTPVTPKRRESRIRALFRSVGVRVRFTN